MNKKRVLAASMIVSMVANTIPVVAAPAVPLSEGEAASATPSVIEAAIPKGTLVLNGLFDVKSMEAGTSKYLYINTYPEKGTEIVEVSTSDDSVVRVSYGNNSEGMAEDDMSGSNSNYNYVKLDAVGAGDATVTVRVKDTVGDLGSVEESFEVQVISPEYEGTERVVTDISNDWRFCLERDMDQKPESGSVPTANSVWEEVTIPHCWNIDDGADGGGNYHKGIGWYMKDFSAEELTEALYGGKQIYLEIGAACKISEVYVNGKKIARHEGGYSRIRVDLTDELKLGQANTIAISVDNRVNNLTPMSGDFTVFGGLYRDISLIAVGDVHMDLDQKTSFGGRGLYVSQRGTENVTADTTVEEVFGGGGRLDVAGEVKNSADEAKTVSAEAVIYDADWNAVADYDFEAVELAPGAYHSFEQELVVDDPHLWNGEEDPYQYNVVFEVSVDGEVVDRERDRVGFRFFCADPDKGFFLNGESYPLRGVNSHQDRFARGYAATHQDREQDLAMISELGANAIRFAHYQHDPLVYELAAERGITVWAEIPMVNSIVNTRAFYESTTNNLRELIHQAYNIPSVLMWGIHNEQWPNNKGITVLLDQLYKTCKEEDPSRLVTVATAQDPGDNVTESNWDSITLSWQSDVSAWNKYFGLYQGKDARYFGSWINQVHDYGAKHKTIYGSDAAITNPEGGKENIPVRVHGNVGMSEYGVEGNPYVHDENPGYSDKADNRSEEWQSQWHEIYYKVINESPWMWGSYIWNMFEFGSDSRNDAGRAGTNNKGIVSYDRTIKKDVFYFYKANWSDEPTLKITGERFEVRNQSDIEVKVYSNMDKVELFVDGVSQGELTANGNQEPALNNQGQPDDTLLPNTQMGKFVWDVNLAGQGEHKVVAVGTDGDGKVYTDTVTWNRKFYEEPGISSTKYNVNSASHTISGVPGGTTVETLKANITPLQNSAFEVYTAEEELIEDPSASVRLGMIVRVTAEDGVHTADYLITSDPITKGKTVSANANQNDSYLAKYAVDGNTTTRWGSGGKFPGWIQIDLGDVYTLDKLDTLWYASSGRNYTFEVVGSMDGENFHTLLPSQNSTQGAAEPTWTGQIFEDGAQARYLKINVTGCSAGSSASPSIYEIQATGFRLNSSAYGINNADRVIVGVDPGTTADELLSSLSVEGDYNTLEVDLDEDGVLTADSVVVINYGDGKEATYTLSTNGPDNRPISQGKPAEALEIDVNGTMIPNEDSGDGCSLDRDHDVAANLVDGDLATRWTGALTGGGHTIPSNAYPAEVLIDLEDEYELNELFMSTYDPKTRLYKFAVYAGNDPDTLKSEENIILDMRDNKEFSSGNKEISGRGRYILLSVTGNTSPSSYRAASVYELSVYGYRFAPENLVVDKESMTVAGVEVQTKVYDFLKDLGIKGNYTAEVLLGGRVLGEDEMITQGAELRISDLNGKNAVTYAIDFEEQQLEVPVSQDMPVHALDVQTDVGVVPNEDAAKGDYAYKINDGDDTTRWVGAFDQAHMNCYYPAAVTVDMTDLQSTSDYYYLTGVKIHFYDAGGRYYKYRISAKNIVGIETGFEVNAEDNKKSGWVEHWTEDGTNEIKDLTLTLTGCSINASYAAAGVYELQIFAWRVLGRDFNIDETNKVIYLGDKAVTLAELRNGLEILGNCTVRFVDAGGKELGWNDSFGTGCKMIVTDIKGHEFVYSAVGGDGPEEPDESDYFTTSISVAKNPDKMQYNQDEEFDPAGMVVEAEQKATASNAERTVTVPNDKLDYDYDFSKAGESKVTITYQDKGEDGEVQDFETFVTVTVNDTEEPDDEYYTRRIFVKEKPTKRTYEIEEEFDPAGMIVQALQEATPSNATRNVTIPNDELEYEYDFSEAGESKVTILYQEEDEDGEVQDFETFVTVTVKGEIDVDDEYYTQKIVVKEKPAKLVYDLDEEFDPDGMVVEAVQKATASNATRNVTVPNDELDYDYDFSEAGERKVTIIYQDEDENGEVQDFVTSVTVTVDDSIEGDDEYYTQRIIVKKKPTKRVYEIDEEFDPTGMVIEADQKAVLSGVTRTITISNDELEYEYDFSTSGTKEVKIIYYGEDKNLEEKKFTAKVRVDVAEEAEEGFYVKEIRVAKLPSQTQYYVGDSLKMNGMEVYAVVVNRLTGKETEEAVTSCKVSPSIFMVPGIQKVTISYIAANEDGKAEVFEDSFSVTVKKPTNTGASSGGHSSGSSTSTGTVAEQTGTIQVATGTWKLLEDGTWQFHAQDRMYQNEWAFIMNPYARPAIGQLTADWFRFDEDGTMVTGWFTDADGLRYYLSEESDGTLGHMVTGWKWLKDENGLEKCYYFNPVSDGTKGKLITNTTTPDGYKVDENGCWIP